MYLEVVYSPKDVHFSLPLHKVTQLLQYCVILILLWPTKFKYSKVFYVWEFTLSIWVIVVLSQLLYNLVVLLVQWILIFLLLYESQVLLVELMFLLLLLLIIKYVVDDTVAIIYLLIKTEIFKEILSVSVQDDLLL